MRQPEPGVFQWTTSTGHTYTRQPSPTTEWDQTPWFAPELIDAITQEIDDGYLPTEMAA